MSVFKDFLTTYFIQPIYKFPEKLLAIFFLHLKIGNRFIKPGDFDGLQEGLEWLFWVDGGEVVGYFSAFVDVI